MMRRNDAKVLLYELVTAVEEEDAHAVDKLFTRLLDELAGNGADAKKELMQRLEQARAGLGNGDGT